MRLVYRIVVIVYFSSLILPFMLVLSIHFPLGYQGGVVVGGVISTKTLAYSIGLREGSLIKRIDRIEMNTAQDLQRVLKSNLGKTVQIMWEDKGHPLIRSVTLPKTVESSSILGITIYNRPNFITPDISNVLSSIFLFPIESPIPLWFIIIPIFCIHVVPPIVHLIDRKKCIKQVDNIFEIFENNKNIEKLMQRLIEKRLKNDELLKKKIFDSTDYEKIESRISMHIYRLNRPRLQNEDLSLYLTSVRDLIRTYNDVYPLMNLRSFKEGGADVGGFIAIFRFRRRIKKNLSRY